MTDTIKEKYSNLRAQAIIFYPFKYKKEIFPSNQKNIKIDPISTEQSENIIYGDFIKYYDTQYNISKNKKYSKTDREFSRSLYTISLDKDNLFMNEAVHKPEYKIDNEKIKEFNNFVSLIQTKATIKREETFSKNNENENINTIVKDIYALANDFPVHLSHANLVLYNKTNIGFLELYINYEYTKPILDNVTLINISKILSNDVGNLKKLFFSKDNQRSIKERIKKSESLYSNNDLNIITSFINSLDIDENINITNDDFMFFNRNFKRRAYAQTNVYINETCYQNLTEKVEDKEEFMMYVGRTHDFDGRELKNLSFSRYIIQNENDNIFGVTNSSFGILSKYIDKDNLNYSMQHLSEQFMFFCEMSLHLRCYLYTMIEVYRKNTGKYYKAKVEFTKNITRYKMSLISEVEPQRVYEKLLEELRIEKLYEDANKALESLQAIEEKSNNQFITIISAILAVFGIFGITNNLSEWLTMVLDERYIGYVSLFTKGTPIATLIIILILAIKRKFKK